MYNCIRLPFRTLRLTSRRPSDREEKGEREGEREANALPRAPSLLTVKLTTLLEAVREIGGEEAGERKRGRKERNMISELWKVKDYINKAPAEIPSKRVQPRSWMEEGRGRITRAREGQVERRKWKQERDRPIAKTVDLCLLCGTAQLFRTMALANGCQAWGKEREKEEEGTEITAAA